jgi:Raf kinase inhibitor-like YbhB/YbcL family protein
MHISAPTIVLASLLSGAVFADPPKRTAATLQVHSSAFNNNGAIPEEYTCEGAEVSPPLAWSAVPSRTKSIAILVEDPDAPKGTFTHWLVTGIPPTTTSLDQGAALPAGAIVSKNDKGAAGYAGPCPPSGRHHYKFQVFALDIGLPKGLTRLDLASAIKGHVLASGMLVGTYQKQAGR